MNIYVIHIYNTYRMDTYTYNIYVYIYIYIYVFTYIHIHIFLHVCRFLYPHIYLRPEFSSQRFRARCGAVVDEHWSRNTLDFAQRIHCCLCRATRTHQQRSLPSPGTQPAHCHALLNQSKHFVSIPTRNLGRFRKADLEIYGFCWYLLKGP